MARGDCERAFGAAAEADGVVMESKPKMPWLNQRGHLGLPEQAARARVALARILEALGGDADDQAAKNLTPLKGDFVHAASGLLVEVDEDQHFTSHRLLTLDPYPEDIEVGFDVEEYRDLCHGLKAKADKAFAYKPTPEFGPRSRPRQRAYYDALRDLAAPVMGRPPVIRAAAPNRNGAAAYAQVRGRVRAAVGLA